MIEIDRTACRAHGVCAGLFPEAVTLDEWGYPIIGEFASRRDERTVAAACPALALHLTRRKPEPDRSASDRSSA
ncbi:hypothetical protein GCM10022261_05130 [Brevibacterium daeguense]|uniref:Ferredoxin n=1 Tax=Brevibacterium daeguense TaxID=909936 RepID=A0ABP8EG83_9MICO|nr:ferredoxin [Brevibacterium daeguense]